MHLYNLFIWEIDKTECISVVGTILQDGKEDSSFKSAVYFCVKINDWIRSVPEKARGACCSFSSNTAKPHWISRYVVCFLFPM
ncbi:hypothetical protein AYX07_05250 [Thermoactinomyces sp. AS95]|nr:hypothetical protein AYX07_05250 [Thermoactinomyces sp. AS95]